MNFITEMSIGEFERDLMDNEKSKATIEKYVTVLKKLMTWLNGREVDHALLMEYRDFLQNDHAVKSVCF